MFSYLYSLKISLLRFNVVHDNLPLTEMVIPGDIVKFPMVVLDIQTKTQKILDLWQELIAKVIFLVISKINSNIIFRLKLT